MKDRGYRGLFLFALPSIFSACLEPLAGIVDTALIGQKSVIWLAGVGVATALINSFSWIFNFLAHVSTQNVGEARSFKNLGMENQRIKVAILTAIGLGALSVLLMGLFRKELYLLGGITSETFSSCDEYFSIRLLASPLSLLFIALLAIARAYERVYLSLLSVLLTTGLNAILSAFFLYYLDWGVSGVAWATVISLGIGVTTLGLVLGREGRWKEVAHAQINRGDWGQFSTKALNMFGRSAFLTLTFFLATRVAAQIGIFALATHQIILQFWLFISFFTDGLAVTATIIVSKHLKERRTKEVQDIILRLVVMAASVGLLFSVLAGFFWARGIELFTHDEYVIDLAIELKWPIVVSQIPLAVAYLFDGVMFGLGEFRFLRKMMTFAFFGVVLPAYSLAYWKSSLDFVWIGLIALGIVRLLATSVQIYRQLKEV